MTTDTPYATDSFYYAEAEAWFKRSVADLEEAGEVAPATMFGLGRALVCSPAATERESGVEQLRDVLAADHPGGISRVDALYFAAKGCFSLGQYVDARQLVEQLLKSRPEHPSGLALHHTLKATVLRDGPVGLGIAVTAAAAVVALGALLWVRSRK
jgi:hypothetical protein